MDKLIKIILAISVLVSFALPGIQKAAASSFSITQVKVTDFNNNTAKINWKTNYQAKGTVFYSTDSSNLNNSISYGAYDYDHNSVLSGLEEDKTYYYKIVAYSRDGERIETFVQNFKTSDMVDTSIPKFLEADLIQVTQNAAIISFKSDEKVKATLYYGKNPENLNQKKASSAYENYNTLTITKLTPYARYYARLEIQDKEGNKAESTKLFDFRTGGDIKDGTGFNIYDIEPLTFDIQYVSDTEVTIKWKTSLASRSFVQYGEKSKKYKEKVYSNDGEWSNIHEIKISNLKPNTSYYFKITAEKSLYGKKASTNEQSISTIPTQQAILGEKIEADNKDSDGDGLSDAREKSLGTNPNNPDTDNDGYRDDIEVKNGYDPKGPGKLVKLIYGKERSSLSHEQTKAIELKAALDKKLGKFNISRNDWFKVVNAYVYGNYPIEAISQCIKWSGKTVHPTINWQLWKEAPDYKNYISK